MRVSSATKVSYSQVAEKKSIGQLCANALLKDILGTILIGSMAK